ncbi:MAG TPA: hypothetical protein VJ911_04980 [Cryomorphaceae bacterium]|nr:hypothetical protein [Cryomorphaceae bacterium]
MQSSGQTTDVLQNQMFDIAPTDLGKMKNQLRFNITDVGIGIGEGYLEKIT